MDNNSQAQAVQQEQESTETTNVQDLVKKEVESVQAEYQKQLEQIQDGYKKEISGLNRRNSDLEKKVQEKELEKLTEDERLQKEIELARQEKDSLLQETERLRKERLIDKALFDAGLPAEFAKRVNGDSEESIKQDVEDIKSFLKTEAEKQAESIINERLGGRAPEKDNESAQETLTVEEIAKLPREQRLRALKKAGY